MQKIVIRLSLLALTLLLAVPAMAQDQVTIRDVNSIPMDQLTALQGGGEALTQDVIDANLFNNDLVGTEITFVAVIMSDPRKSGLSNVTDGRVDRVHMFVRDTSAVSQGPEGMGIQVVDGAYDTNNLLDFNVGDVIQITGAVSPFGTVMQIAPTTITLLGPYTALGIPDSILDPVVITSDEANLGVGTDGIQINWANYPELQSQYVKIESATIQTRSLANPDRPDFYVSSDGGTTVVNFYDTGLQYRNDRGGSYPDNFGVLEEDFVPPPPGSVIDIQGFLVYQPGADQIGRSVPANAVLSIVPFERGGCLEGAGDMEQCDLVVLESPPVITGVTGPDFVPDGSAPVTISFIADADPTRTITATFCEYFTSEDANVQSVDAAQNGDVLECAIPAQGDGVFVTYAAGATDSEGATSLSDEASYRTLANGITSIEEIQLTIDEGPGASPFAGITTDLNITATVTASFEGGFGPIVVIQDDTGLAGWTGVALSTDATLSAGDEVTITNAEITESFDITTISVESANITVNSSGNPVEYKEVPTSALLDPSTAEAHEAMILRFVGVIAGENPDGSSDFGEWSFATAGTEDFIRGDDLSADIPNDFNASLAPGTEIASIQGVWWFTFGNYKLIPSSPMDVVLSGTSSEDEILPSSFALDQNYPNPFNPVTTISYQVPSTGLVTLEVFDLLGRSVRVLVDGTVAAGQYTVDFEAANLPSGVYLYRLTAGENVETKKMLLMK